MGALPFGLKGFSYLAWWHTPIIPVLRRLTQEHLKFSLGYKPSQCRIITGIIFSSVKFEY
jgi:hypothetical protein